VKASARDYRSIRGSAALGTAPVAAVPEIARAEALAPGEMRRIAFQGELLGAACVRASFAALPLEAFDRAGEVLAADEQGAYFQLLRLAYGEGRNFCRAGKKDLLSRLGVSERRLHRVLDALVAKGFLRPLHRDNRGTLWRVYLPQEAFGDPVGDDVLLGRASTAAPACEGADVRPAAPVVKQREDPATTRLLGLARQLTAARGTPGGVDAAAAELAALAADGATPRQIAACVDAAIRRATPTAPLEKGAAP
jgi:hypothetical protein